MTYVNSVTKSLVRQTFRNTNCIIDFMDQPFSDYLFDGQCLEFVNNKVLTIDLMGISLISESKINYIVKKLKEVYGVKNVYLNGNEIHFRKAYTQDIPKLNAIFKENSVINGGKLYCEDAAPNNHNLQNVFILEHLGNSVAYVTLDNLDTIHNDVKESIIFEAHINLNEFIYIKQCAVKKEEQGKGYGIRLYEELFKYHNCSFLAHVSVKNLPSLKLHYRTGFHKIGVYQTADFHGTQGYVSDLVYRKKVKN